MDITFEPKLGETTAKYVNRIFHEICERGRTQDQVIIYAIMPHHFNRINAQALADEVESAVRRVIAPAGLGMTLDSANKLKISVTVRDRSN